MTQFHIIQSYDPRTDRWSPLSLLDTNNPIPRVRDALGGRWTRSEGHLENDMAAAFWNGANGRRVFVWRLPRGLPQESALRVMNAQAADDRGRMAA